MLRLNLYRSSGKMAKTRVNWNELRRQYHSPVYVNEVTLRGAACLRSRGLVDIAPSGSPTAGTRSNRVTR